MTTAMRVLSGRKVPKSGDFILLPHNNRRLIVGYDARTNTLHFIDRQREKHSIAFSNYVLLQHHQTEVPPIVCWVLQGQEVLWTVAFQWKTGQDWDLARAPTADSARERAVYAIGRDRLGIKNASAGKIKQDAMDALAHYARKSVFSPELLTVTVY